MHFSSKFLSGLFTTLSLLQLSSQAPLEGADLSRRQTVKEDPCTKVGHIYNTGNPKVPGELAYQCLKSIPFNSTQAVYITQQARGFSRLLSYQAFYNKPENLGLNVQRIDLNSTLNSIEARAKRSNGYDSEYSFNRALAELFGRYHDGHTAFAAHSSLALGSFVHDYPLAAAVPQGEKQPKIYLTDIVKGTVGEEVVEIAGQPAIKHLLELVDNMNGPTDSGWIDADTRWNKMFMEFQIGGKSAGNFAHRDFYPGRDFKMKLANGTEIEVKWYTMNTKGDNVKASAGMFNSTETYKEAFMAAPAEPEENTTKTSSLNGPGFHPWSIVQNKEGRGKYLDARKLATVPGVILKDMPPVAYPPVIHRMKSSEQTLHILNNTNVAVWSFSAFMSRSHGLASSPEESLAFFMYWRQHMEETFAILKQRNIKKLILDFSNNGGGRVILGLETIRAFFPTLKPFNGMDFRRSPAVDVYVTEMEKMGTLLQANGEEFQNEETLLGPIKKYDDYFTNITRHSILDSVRSEIPGVEFNQTGEGMFKVEDIVLLTEGACGSTCVIVHEALTEHGVASIAVGGRPVSPNVNKTMQSVGGVKGFEVAHYSTFEMIGRIPEFANVSSHFPKPLPVQMVAQMNLRNSYEIHDLTVPLELKYQPAEGHMWFTKEMVADRTKVWQEAAKMAWDAEGKNLLMGKSPKKSDGKQPEALKIAKRTGWAAALKSRARL